MSRSMRALLLRNGATYTASSIPYNSQSYWDGSKSTLVIGNSKHFKQTRTCENNSKLSWNAAKSYSSLEHYFKRTRVGLLTCGCGFKDSGDNWTNPSFCFSLPTFCSNNARVFRREQGTISFKNFLRINGNSKGARSSKELKFSGFVRHREYLLRPRSWIVAAECIKLPNGSRKIHQEVKDDSTAKSRPTDGKFKELREDVMTIPNFLSFLRIALSPVIGYYAILEHYILALGIFGVAAVTDLLDGYIARHFQSQKSVFGSILDPAADKILMTVLFISLTLADLIPVPLSCLVIGRDVALVAGVSYLRYKTLPAPKTIARYFDVNHPTVQLHPTFISKVNTFLQVGLVGAALAAPVLNMGESVLLQGYMYLVASTTVISAFSYVFSKDTFQILKKLPK